jgi:hypothetical protein
LDGHLKSPWAVVDVRPKVSDRTKVTGERVRHHEDDIRVSAKLIGLAKHVGEGVGDVVALNDHLLGERQQKMSSKVGLESGGRKCDAGGNVVSYKNVEVSFKWICQMRRRYFETDCWRAVKEAVLLTRAPQEKHHR